MKIKMRVLGQAIGSKCQYREDNILKTATDYLQKAVLLNRKMQETLKECEGICSTVADYGKFFELQKFVEYHTTY